MSYRVPQRLAHVVIEPMVHGDDAAGFMIALRPVPGGPNLMLEGSGALIWLLAVEGEADVATELAKIVGRPITDIQTHVDSFLAELVDKGLLERAT